MNFAPQNKASDGIDKKRCHRRKLVRIITQDEASESLDQKLYFSRSF